ncbi:hypothetical protein [Vulcanococcus sp. Clear-D1]|jgi:hypothetical protein|uniref:hypothetical protein n=1 Tax=Vulcanococcus sp. Clear-D1 TaxID=2766970 RepID=UPI00198D875D|nr:hypothetical protein [Vulcanococcus sp. Clear-D1]MBD1193662.1 hypothetical protein [Vulcanococcus sp. Clear-D1]
MSWDPALLRKYSSTNHYKLLNQVRSDLKEQPIQRSSGGSSRRSSSAGSGSSSSSGSGGTRRRSVPAPVPQATPMQSTPANSFDPFVTVPVLIAPFE